MECTCKKETPIAGISCEVTNCEYHGEGKECCANAISVCTCDPVQTASVTCSTFKPKTGR